jgi:hypothetical protein
MSSPVILTRRMIRRTESLDCDETGCRIVPSGLLIWAPVRTNEIVVRLLVNEMDSVTVLANVAATGTKLPFLWNE